MDIPWSSAIRLSAVLSCFFKYRSLTSIQFKPCISSHNKRIKKGSVRMCQLRKKKQQSNIQCQLALSAIATELAPIVQAMQFCYIGKIPKSYVLFRISILVTSYIMKLACYILRSCYFSFLHVIMIFHYIDYLIFILNLIILFKLCIIMHDIFANA